MSAFTNAMLPTVPPANAFAQGRSSSFMPMATAMSLSLVLHGGLILLTMETPVGQAGRSMVPDASPVLLFDLPPIDAPRREPLPEATAPPLAALPPEQPPQIVPPPPPPPPVDVEKLALGIDDGAEASENWIGYREFIEHFAPHSTTDQAAKRLEAGGEGGRAMDPAAPSPTPPSMAPLPDTPPPSAPSPLLPTPTPRTAATEQQPAATEERGQPNDRDPRDSNGKAEDGRAADASTTRPSEAAKPVPETPFPSERPTGAPRPAPIAMPRPSDPTTPSGPENRPAIDSPIIDPPSSTSPLPDIPLPTPPSAIPESGPQAPPQDPSAPAPRPAPGGEFVGPPDPTLSSDPPAPQAPNLTPPPTTPGNVAANPNTPGPTAKENTGDGEVTDSESDPTSVVVVPPAVWRNGKPIAAKGLTIKTRKPKFTVLTMVTRAPRNPTVSISFDREGNPVDYRFEVTAGHPDIDGPILDAIAAWRASGKELAKLGPKDTVTIRIKLLLVQ